MASAIIATGLTVGCSASSSSSAGASSVHAAILPDIGAVAAVLAELEAVDVRRRAVLEGEDQLMPGAIEGAHAAIVLDPDDQVLEFANSCASPAASISPMCRQSMQMKWIEPSME